MYDQHAATFLGRAAGPLAALLVALLVLLAPAGASAQFMCGLDANGDGFVDAVNETAICDLDVLCPLDATPCVSDPTGDICPLGPSYSCVIASDGVSKCSAQTCVDTAANPLVDEERPRDYVVDDGARDGAGACLDELRIFQGYAMDCKPAGAQTVFRNCCKDRGQIIHDSQGAVGSVANAVAINAVFTAMSAAYAAGIGGGGSSALSVLSTAFDPTTLAATALVALITDLLNLGCSAQDMETGVLKGSGMCHYVGSYCTARIPLIGCIQKSRSHCCFNSKLGRIIHEQGRPQLVSFAGWGTAKAPDCRGFTPAEFQALDFSAMDLSEYYGELALTAASAMETQMQGAVGDYAADAGVQ